MKPRPLSFAKALTIVRDRLKADPALFNGWRARVDEAGCGCLFAHVADVIDTHSDEVIKHTYPTHWDWLWQMVNESCAHAHDPAWAISTLDAKLASLKAVATKRRAARS